MRYLLDTIIPNNSFSERIRLLLDKYDNIDPNALGFKENWRNEELWS